MSLTINGLSVANSIKEATQDIHQEVESLLLPKLSSIQTLDDYAAILQMFYGYYQPLEKEIERYITPTVLADIEERRKASTILHDLSKGGYTTENLSLCSRLPKIENRASAFGALYVLEGSTLGGKMIAKMLLKNKAVTIPEEMLTFFSGYKEQTGPKWTSFLQVLNEQEEVDEMIACANETFFYLKSWMQQTMIHE